MCERKKRVENWNQMTRKERKVVYEETKSVLSARDKKGA